jgi:hypothetical protein
LVKKDPKNLVPVKKKSVSNSSCKKKREIFVIFLESLVKKKIKILESSYNNIGTKILLFYKGRVLPSRGEEHTPRCSREGEKLSFR